MLEGLTGVRSNSVGVVAEIKNREKAIIRRGMAIDSLPAFLEEYLQSILFIILNSVDGLRKKEILNLMIGGILISGHYIINNIFKPFHSDLAALCLFQ
jgi:hypothetical protein